MSTAVASKTILVVEDEPLIRMAVADELRDVGYHVLEASDAAQAQNIFKATPEVDLLFTDVKMPGEIDGLDLSYWAKARKTNLLIVVASGHVSHDEVLARGCPDVTFQKPYDVSDLIATVHSLLKIQ